MKKDSAYGNGRLAWSMNSVIQGMNNEDAYYGGWLYIWPDGETFKECLEDFADDDSFNELKESYLRNFKAYYKDGLYNVTPSTIDFANKTLKEIGIQNAKFEESPKSKGLWLVNLENAISENEEEQFKLNIQKIVDDYDEEDIEEYEGKNLLVLTYYEVSRDFVKERAKKIKNAYPEKSVKTGEDWDGSYIIIEM